MLDDRFEDQLHEVARDYHTPPETPREAMWAAIQAQRAERKRADKTEKTEKTEKILPLRPFRHLRPFHIAAGIAALLALGFAAGRLTQGTDSTPPAAIATDASPRVSDAAYRLVTTEHLSQSEAFLTLFRASVRRGGNEQLASATARQLLATNRLLLDSPASSDARIKLLLQDLELVLAEIAQLDPQPRSDDLALISEGLDQGDVLFRLRTAVPSGASTTQGAL
jgi:hypothetical protein